MALIKHLAAKAKLRPVIIIDLSLKDFITAALCLLLRRRPLPPKPEHLSDGITFASVRSGFDQLLAHLQLPAGSEILMTALTIPDMEVIPKWHHLVPVPVDIDPQTLGPNLLSLKHALTERTKAMVVTHLFGSRNELEEVSAFTKQHNLILIEDCAQAFDGQYKGSTFADISMFSFGPIKRQTALCGARFMVKDPAIREGLRQRALQLPPMPWNWFFLRIIRFACLKIISTPPIYGMLDLLCSPFGSDAAQMLYKLSRGFRRQNLQNQIRRKLSPAAERFLRLRMQRKKRTFSVKILVNRIGYQSELKELGGAAPDHAYWLVALQSQKPQQDAEKLRQHGVASSASLASLTVIAAESGPCIQAETIKKQLLCLNPEPRNLLLAEQAFSARKNHEI